MNKIVLLILFTLELLLFLFCDYFGAIKNGALLFSTSMLIGLYPILNRSWIKKDNTIEENLEGNNSSIYFLFFSLLGFVLIVNMIFSSIIANTPVIPLYSDIIPSIKVLVERFIAGISVYGTPIPFDGYEVPPTYLPLQWGPFIIAHKYNFDYRSLAFILLLVGIIIYAYYVIKSKISTVSRFLLIALPFITLTSLFYFTKMEFVYTVETMVAGFYLILAATLFSKSPIIRSIGVVLCLLSRFSLLFWLPVYFIVMLFESKKDAIKLAVYSFIGVAGLYIIPFLYNDWGAFMRGYHYYTQAALSEWGTQFYQPEGADPFHLFEGIGLTSLFYKYVQGTVEYRLSVLQKSHMIFIMFISGLSILYYYLLRRKNIVINTSIFLLLTLKIYLTVFYTFIQVPYKYLYFVPLFLSCFIVALVFNGGAFNTSKKQ